MFFRKKINIAVLMALACPAGVALAQDEKPVKAPTVEVIGTREALKSIPGSAEVVDKKTLENSRVFTVGEALRKVPGVMVRDEEGFGLRPNIGIRGLDPTRSAKLLLLEDGIPLAYAPYGDNSTYYHPPVDRFERIEVLKGSGQILYGPQTIGGVINFITPLPPARPGGSVTLTGGNRDYFNGRFNYGGTWGSKGLLFDYVRKQGDGARDNTHAQVDDLNVKAVLGLSAQQALTLRANYFGEESNVTYSGLTEAEYTVNPRQNPFKNDFMNAKRYGASATHEFVFSDNVILTTNLYGSIFQRDWWRQSSNSGERPNDSADAACGGMTNLNTTCGNQGRLRNYYTWGVEPRLRVNHSLFGVKSEADMGVRAHYELQDRLQMNGNTPQSRTAAISTGTSLLPISEDNERKNQAYSAFVQNRFLLDAWTVTPGVRVESIKYERTNRLANGGAGVSGKTDLTQVIPGIGATYNPLKNTTLFAGVHRGFAPPRTEDIISNAGGTVDLNAEKSVNYELGVRTQPRAGISAEATLFRMDFQNQIVAASVAGGTGAALTNAGETLHQGAELGLRLNSGEVMDSPHNVYLQAAYTYLPTAKFTGTRTSTSGANVSGNRLPYAPENLLTTTLGYAHASGFDARVEAVHVSDQFSDDVNTVTPTANGNGQRGQIAGYTIWNAAVNYLVKPLNTTLFLTAKNLTDKTYIVDRTRGILPGMPRLIQAGFTYRF